MVFFPMYQAWHCPADPEVVRPFRQPVTGWKSAASNSTAPQVAANKFAGNSLS